MKIENVTYKCDCCKEESTGEMLFHNIRIETPETGCGPYDLCSIECFIKKFNQCMDEDGVEVSIGVEE